MPAFVSKLSPEQWAEAKRLRAEGASYAGIARQFGISENAVGRHAHKNNWSGSGAPAVPASPRRTGTPIRSGPIARLQCESRLRMLRILNLDLKIMEQRMQKRVDAAKEVQANVEALGLTQPEMDHMQSITTAIDNVTELQPDIDPAAGGRGKSEPGAKSGSKSDTEPSEADVFRTEIAERLEKLLPPA
jgi:hypothetical protein